MYFRDTVHSPEEWLSYERKRNQLAAFVGDCVAFLGDAMSAVDQSPAVKDCFSHGTIVALLRHQLAATDGIAILVSEGCVDGGRKRRRGDRVAAVQNGGAQPCRSLGGEDRGDSPDHTPFQREAQECTATWRCGARYAVRC
jgi:hypothetical protein